MPDPHMLYVVTAIVVLGLVVWVGTVLARPADDNKPRSDGKRTRWSPSASDSGAEDDPPQSP